MSAVIVATATPSAHPCGGQRPAKRGGGVWTCTFDDEFSGTALDTTKWTAIRTADYGFHSGAECFVDNARNVSVSGGHLSLTARKQAAPFTCNDPSGSYTTQYTSGSVTGLGKFAQTYGRFSVRARFPATTIAGLQSSLWMWPQNPRSSWPTSGEIDIAEEYSQYADRAIPTLHYTFDPATFDQPFFMILTQALGIGTNAFDPATTPLPATTQVDWARVWK